MKVKAWFADWKKKAPRLEKLSTAKICKELWAQLLTSLGNRSNVFSNAFSMGNRCRCERMFNESDNRNRQGKDNVWESMPWKIHVVVQKPLFQKSQTSGSHIHWILRTLTRSKSLACLTAVETPPPLKSAKGKHDEVTLLFSTPNPPKKNITNIIQSLKLQLMEEILHHLIW